jgi:LAO/AO transport system kinase
MLRIAEQILAGDTRALARAATLIEERHPEAEALLRELFPRTGRALIVGVTGPPGSGKSTLCDQIIHALRAERKTVGVIAVDPSSPYTGGAILGDRVRMQGHHSDPGVFIRSMATRGWLGGLARATAEVAILLDAAGRDVILVETVGAGQAEVDIARLAGVTLVVLAPGMGDDVQAIKAGIMEIADVFVLNKSDHPGAAKFEQELLAAIRLGNRETKVVKTVASEGQGVSEVLAAAREAASRAADPEHAARVWSLRLREMLAERMLDRIPPEEFLAAGRDVAARRTDPYTALDPWLKKL